MAIDWMTVGMSAVAAVGSAVVTAVATIATQRDKIRQDHEAQLERLREQLKLEYSVETAIQRLLGKQGWELRRFETIEHHVRGFSSDKLREHLVRAGAIAFEDDDGIEKWGLLKLNTHRLARKGSSK